MNSLINKNPELVLGQLSDEDIEVLLDKHFLEWDEAEISESFCMSAKEAKDFIKAAEKRLMVIILERDPGVLQAKNEETAIRDAIQEYAKWEGGEYEKLSKEFEKEGKECPKHESGDEDFVRMLKVIEKDKNKSKSTGHIRVKAAAVTAAALVILFASAFSVQGVRDFTVDLFLGNENVYGGVRALSNGLFFEGEDYCAPKLLPKGYSISSYNTAGGTRTIEYADDKNNILVFTQRSSDFGGTIDTEDSNVKSVTVGDSKAQLSEKEDGSCILVWQADDYLFSLTSSTKLDLVSIAESVSKK